MGENNRIQLPNQVSIRAQFHPGENADPVMVQMKVSDGICTMVTGGETKLERHTVAMLAGMLGNSAVLLDENCSRDVLVERAVDLAERVQVVLRERAELKAADDQKEGV